MKDLPVNILSTRRLANLFPDAEGRPDFDWTGMNSKFNIHVLTWNRGQYCKTFSTAGSGPLECLFNAGYSIFQTYTSCVEKYNNNSTSWTFASGVEPRQVSEGDNFASEPRQTMGNLAGLTLILSDGFTTKELVTSVGVEFVKETEHRATLQSPEKRWISCSGLPRAAAFH